MIGFANRTLFAGALLSIVLAATGSAQAVQPAPQTAQINGATPISLDEAIRLAQRNSPAAIQARGTERTAAASRRAAMGALFPNLALSAGRVIQLGGAQTRINQ